MPGPWMGALDGTPSAGARRLPDAMDHIEIFFIMQAAADVPSDEAWLSGGERIRAAELRFPKRRNDWLLGRWTAKAALRAFLARAGGPVPEAAAIEILAAPDGAPELMLFGQPGPVSLALSHSAGRGFCALCAPGIPLGCDVEAIPPRILDFIGDYLREEEHALIAAAPAGLQAERATLIWSAKESALKCLREGLRRDTRSVVVSLGDSAVGGWQPLSVECLESGRRFPGWCRAEPGWVQTIAAGTDSNEPFELRG